MAFMVLYLGIDNLIYCLGGFYTLHSVAIFNI